MTMTIEQVSQWLREHEATMTAGPDLRYYMQMVVTIHRPNKPDVMGVAYELEAAFVKAIKQVQ